MEIVLAQSEVARVLRAGPSLSQDERQTIYRMWTICESHTRDMLHQMTGLPCVAKVPTDAPLCEAPASSSTDTISRNVPVSLPKWCVHGEAKRQVPEKLPLPHVWEFDTREKYNAAIRAHKLHMADRRKVLERMRDQQRDRKGRSRKSTRQLQHERQSSAADLLLQIRNDAPGQDEEPSDSGDAT